MRHRPLLPLIALLPLLVACGEVERVELTVRPRQDDFERHVQPLLEHLGCSRGGGCHALPLGELQILVEPDPDELQANYLSVKAKLNLDDPPASPILAKLLAGSPEGTHRPLCFASAKACAYRKLLAWIAWTGAGDPRPQDIACDYSGERCP